jgi:PAS domain S-box-containing protein
MVETLGYTEEELLMHPFLDFVHAKYQKEIENSTEKALKHLNLKIDGFVKDDSIKWLVWSAIAEPATGLMYVARDITELVKLESEQKKTIDALYQNEN